MRTVFDAKSGRIRLTAALALLAVLLSVLAVGPRAGAAAGLLAAAGQGEGWLNADASQPAKVERGQVALGEKEASGPASPPEQPSALALGAAARLQPPCAFAVRPAVADRRGGDPPYRRPEPTGPPLLG